MNHKCKKLFGISTTELLLGISFVLSGFASDGILAAQGPSISNVIPRLNRPTGENFLSIRVLPTYTPETQADILDRDNYRVFRTTPANTRRDRYLKIDRITIDPDEKFEPDDRVLRSAVRIYLSEPLDVIDGDKLIVSYIGKTLGGVKVDSTLTVNVDNPLNSPPPNQPEPTASPSGSLTLKAADGREDADLYFQGEVNTASGKAVSGSVDLKFKMPFYLKTRHVLSPFIDLKASSSPDADPDTLKTGLEVRSILTQAGDGLSPESPISGIRWYNDGVLEGDRDYHNLNLLLASEFRFPLKSIWLTNRPGDRAFINLTPFLGTELGKNLQSPVSEAEGRGIVRLYLGTYLFARIYQGKEAFARVTLDGLYQRRWSLKNEVHFKDIDAMDATLKPIKITAPVFFGKRPSQWAEANLNINFSETLGFFAGYEYGELPPSYKLVNHVAKFGITLKAKIK